MLNQKAHFRQLIIQTYPRDTLSSVERVWGTLSLLFSLAQNPSRTRSSNAHCSPRGKEKLINSETGEPSSLITDLLSADQKVLIIDVFGTGEHSDYERSEDTNFFTTYNRTTAALRVQDIVTALHCFTNRGDVSEVNLIGIGEAGLWSLLAAGFTDVKKVVVDAAQYALDSDAAFWKLYRYRASSSRRSPNSRNTRCTPTADYSQHR